MRGNEMARQAPRDYTIQPRAPRSHHPRQMQRKTARLVRASPHE
jgi:hypothetical protein